MSGTFQALQSYRYEDVIWNNAASFHPCVSDEQEIVRVDLDRFHSIDTPTAPGGMNRPSLRTHDSFVSEGCNCSDPLNPSVCTVDVPDSAETADSAPNKDATKGHRKIKSMPTTVKIWEAIAEEDGEISNQLNCQLLSSRDISQRSSNPNGGQGGVYDPDAEDRV